MSLYVLFILTVDGSTVLDCTQIRLKRALQPETSVIRASCKHELVM